MSPEVKKILIDLSQARDRGERAHQVWQASVLEMRSLTEQYRRMHLWALRAPSVTDSHWDGTELAKGTYDEMLEKTTSGYLLRDVDSNVIQVQHHDLFHTVAYLTCEEEI